MKKELQERLRQSGGYLTRTFSGTQNRRGQMMLDAADIIDKEKEKYNRLIGAIAAVDFDCITCGLKTDADNATNNQMTRDMAGDLYVQLKCMLQEIKLQT